MNIPDKYRVKILSETITNIVEIANGGSMNSDLVEEIRAFSERVIRGAEHVSSTKA